MHSKMNSEPNGVDYLGGQVLRNQGHCSSKLWTKLRHRLWSFMKKNVVFFFSIPAATICFGVFSWLICCPSIQPRITDQAVWIFALGIACLLFPFVSTLSVGNLIKLERVVERVAELVRGELIRTPTSTTIFYVDNDGNRFETPDEETRRFLMSPRGILFLKDDELEKYPFCGVMESIQQCKIWAAEGEGHLFAILNGKKYYVNSWSLLYDFKRSEEKFASLTAEKIRAIPTAR